MKPSIKYCGFNILINANVKAANKVKLPKIIPSIVDILNGV